MSSALPIDLVLERLPDAHKVGAGWSARCPAHDDARPSLSISVGEASRVLLHCHAGCASEAVVERLGLTMTDLFVSAQPGDAVRAERKCRVSRHEIRDIEGRLQAVHVRVDGPRGKTFTWEGPDGTMGLSGRSSTSLPLYRSETLKGAPVTEPVLVTEGEAAADALATIWPGLIVATVTGAASTPTAEVLDALRGHRAILWPDRDAPGAQHMERLGTVLLPIAAAVGILDVPGLPDHGDAADYVRAGRGPDELLRLMQSASDVSAQTSRPGRAEASLRFRTARELAAGTAASVPWRAKPYLVDGAVLEVVGKIKAAGKTTFVMHMCRAILEGDDFLGEPTVRGGVIYLTEQPDSSLRETLRRAGLLDRDDVVVLIWTDTGALSWPEVVDAAMEEAERRGASVLVVDTLSRFAGIHGDGENNAGEADAASAPLLRAAARGLAVISVRHERKAGGDVGDSGRGSSAFGGAVDTVIAIRRGEGKSASGVRIIAALSRFDGVPETLVVELTEAGYISHGDETAVAAAEARATILDRAPSNLPGFTFEELRDKVPRTTAQRAIDSLLAEGQLRRRGAGKRGDPYRFVSAQAPSLDGQVVTGSLPLNLGIFGSDDEGVMGTA